MIDLGFTINYSEGSKDIKNNCSLNIYFKLALLRYMYMVLFYVSVLNTQWEICMGITGFSDGSIDIHDIGID